MAMAVAVAVVAVIVAVAVVMCAPGKPSRPYDSGERRALIRKAALEVACWFAVAA